MSVSGTTSRAVRSLAHRVSIDWSRPIWTASPELAAGFNAIKSWVAMADSTAEKYSKPPTPIEFNKVNVRDKELVQTLQAFYQSNQPPPETHSMPEQEKAEQEETLTYLKEVDEINKELLPVIEQEIDFYSTTRTTRDTTLVEMFENYPLIHEEIEDEIEQREFFKDIGLEGK